MINANSTYFLPTATRSSLETGLGIIIQQCHSRITCHMARATRLQDNFITTTYTTLWRTDNWTVHTKSLPRCGPDMQSGLGSVVQNHGVDCQRSNLHHIYCIPYIPARAACSGFLLSARTPTLKGCARGILRGGARWRIGVGQPAPVNIQNSQTGVYYPYGI